MALADDLVAVHSTDPATVYLSLLARMQRPDLDAVERALYTDRALVRHHSLRRTLWVASRPMTRRLHSAATLGLLRQGEGVDVLQGGHHKRVVVVKHDARARLLVQADDLRKGVLELIHIKIITAALFQRDVHPR